MIRLKLICDSMTGPGVPGGVMNRGDVGEFPQADAERMIRAGLAVPHPRDGVETATNDPHKRSK